MYIVLRGSIYLWVLRDFEYIFLFNGYLAISSFLLECISAAVISASLLARLLTRL